MVTWQIFPCSRYIDTILWRQFLSNGNPYWIFQPFFIFLGQPGPYISRGSCLKSKRPWLRVWKCSRGSRIVASLDSKIMSSELDGTEVNEEQTIYYVCMYIYIYTRYIIILYIYSSGETRCMLLDSFTKHPSRSSADHISKSVLCGRCGTVDYHPLLNLYDLTAFGEW